MSARSTNLFILALMPRLMGYKYGQCLRPKQERVSFSNPPFSRQKASSIAIRNTPLVTMPTASTSSGSPSALSISSIVHGAKYDDAQNNVSQGIGLKKYRDAAWPATTLPPNFWTETTSAAMDQFDVEGSHTMRKIIFKDMPSLPATEDEFEIIATVITSPKTLAGFFKIFGHDKDCQGCPCPLHVPGPNVKIERAFRIYVGALVSLSDEHGYLRLKPWGVRLFSSLAKLALLGIRPNALDEKPRKTLKTPKDDGGKRKKSEALSSTLVRY
ncbi:hypothetical protein B0H16DRAFT_348996 [Mycena metata]|uniref:Uncharacterized protein n=1 Tax=Mycena metata TaxID=1033252 RepID=A0AAD7HKP2_9AGAR|nr:hypothetical protein B0H16DRAFT_348996 [Mycena metata]